MTLPDPKATLLRYLDSVRDALLWKLDGLPEYDVRRPLTPTGTNLLGLVKHVASVEAGYLGLVFDRPFPDTRPWMLGDAEPNADMWATEEESREEILDLYRRVREHAAATVEALELDSRGTVPWWGEARREVSLHQILVHLVAELNRHAGQADILRETLDGSAGLVQGNDNLVEGDQAWWQVYHARLEQAARTAAGLPPA
ncbi:DinB family protein [Nonomuraea sp. NPDC050310]|uniref:DinB family protein n=1 Tax=Nonomuraea sp. NPDC050310 TaxID=3154935 RepID=UPI00340F7141